MENSAAETLGLEALAWLAGEEAAFMRFLDLSGLAPRDLRARAGEPDMLAGVLDFLLSDEKLLTEFCATNGTNPLKIAAARRALPGAPADS